MFELLLKRYNEIFDDYSLSHKKRRSIKGTCNSYVIFFLKIVVLLFILGVMVFFFRESIYSKNGKILYVVLSVAAIIGLLFILRYLDLRDEQIGGEDNDVEKQIQKHEQESRMYKMIKLLNDFNIEVSIEEVERLYRYTKEIRDAKELKNEKYSFIKGPLILAVVTSLIFPIVSNYLQSGMSKIKHISINDINTLIIGLLLLAVALDIAVSSFQNLYRDIFKDNRLECFMNDVSSLMLFPEKTQELYEKVKKDEELTFNLKESQSEHLLQ